MEALRVLYKVKRWLVSWCYSKEESFKFSSELLGNSDARLQWMVVIPNDVVLRESITKTQLDTSTTKYMLWNPRDFYSTRTDDEKIKLFETPIQQPWLWIGGTDIYGNEIDMTSQLESYLIYGNVIKPYFLHLLNPNIVKWTYLDQTFNQVEFPANGIVIKNDSIKQETTETSTEKED